METYRRKSIQAKKGISYCCEVRVTEMSHFFHEILQFSGVKLIAILRIFHSSIF